MSIITWEIFIVFLLIVANGLFAMSEMALVTARKSRLQDWASKGSARAKVANAPNRILSSIQIGITLIGILAGAFAGRTIADRLGSYLGLIPAIEPYRQEIGLGIVVIVITYFALVIGELVPKRLALHNPESIATLVAIPLRAFSTISSPVVHALSISTDALFRLLGRHPLRSRP
jgi:putative hemolysin